MLRRDWLPAVGRTLAQIESDAIRSSYERQRGKRPRMMAELQISAASLSRKLKRLGLAPKAKPHTIREADLRRAFTKHRKAICRELRVMDSTFVRWLNAQTPLAPEGETP